ncbi:hypothetical protein B4U79_14567, partial [Dinothrombium tinctorium]
EDNCCPLPRCICRPESCTRPTCPSGLVLKLKSKGSGSPGSCCDIYDCAKDTRSCHHENKTYANGEQWKIDKCTHCECRNGLKFCKTKTCDYGECSGGDEPGDECCPRCAHGCFDEKKRKAYHTNQSWLEDDCTTCECSNGKISCVSTVCQAPQCADPKWIPGECCPYCEECEIECEYGFKRALNGEQLCECITLTRDTFDPMFCSPYEKCDLNCSSHGYVISSEGCALCECNNKPCLNETTATELCDKECKYGFKIDEIGCVLCECALPELTNDSQTLATTKDDESCYLHDKVYRNGQTWNETCHECVCRDSQAMCTPYLCPRLSCANVRVLNDSCCPLCSKDDIVQSESTSHSLCNSQDKLFHEFWSSIECMNCTCRDEKAYCKVNNCPPAACSSPIYVPGGNCCPTCVESQTFETTPEKRKRNATRIHCAWEDQVYHEGQSWRKSPCESCICENGEQICFQENCSQDLKFCKHLIYIKNKCCPLCIKENSLVPTPCIYNEKNYENGEKWDINECVECLCIDGKSFCSEKFDCESKCEKTSESGDSNGKCCSPKCNASSSSMTQISAVMIFLIASSITLFVVVSLIALRPYRRNRHSSATSWPSTTTTNTNFDDREHSRLNISYSKIEVT